MAETAAMEGTLAEHIRALESRKTAEVERAANALSQLVVRLCDAGGVGTTRKRKISMAQSKDLEQFLTLQDSFTFNITGRLALLLEDFVLASADTTGNEPDRASAGTESCALAVLTALQGVCLVHQPSRLVFNNDLLLGQLIKCINHKSPEVQKCAIDTLVSIMVRQVENIRRFEDLGGLKVVTDIFKHRLTTKQVKLTILQFLFFYMVPETKYTDITRTIPRRATAAKQQMLAKYLSNVDGLVREMEINQPFGTLDLEW